MAALDIALQTAGGDAVPYCPLTVRNAAETAIIAGPSRTDSDGALSLELDAAAYMLRLGPLSGYDFSSLTGTDGTTPGSGHPYAYTLGAAADLTLTCAAAAQRFDGYTFENLTHAVWQVIQIRYIEKQIPFSLIQLWVRAANLEVDARVGWSKGILSLVSTQGQIAYYLWDAPRDVKEVIYNDGTTENLLEPLEWGMYLRKRQSDDGESTPKHWARWQDSIYLHPAPDTTGQAMTVYMTQAPPLLSATTDTPALPPQYHRAIVDLSLSLACADLPGLEQAGAMYLQRYEAAMNSLVRLPDAARTYQAVEVIPGV